MVVSGQRTGMEALAQANGDPTKTKALRGNYAARLRSAFAGINAVIRPAVRTRDVLQLRNEALAEEPPQFRDRRAAQRAEAFEAWLQRQIDNDVLTVIGPNRNQFVRTAYGRGLEDARKRLEQAGVQTEFASLEASFNMPIHRDTLEQLYTQDYQQLRGVTEATRQQVARVVTEGFRSGIAPTVMARQITDRVDKIGKTRATTLARTSVIRAYNDAALNRYERAGVESVTADVEFVTAGDRRVCAQCRGLEGNVYSIREARGEIPVHARCRCAWIPRIRD